MSRPRGFTQWKPQARTLPQLEAVQGIIAEYRNYLPITLRQLYYRLVGKNLLDKTEGEYKRLGEMINRARRARLIDMDAIRDDGFTGGWALRNGYRNAGEFIKDTINGARRYRRDRQEGQESRLILWCEASGMVPQLERVARDYGVLVKSSGGFDSVTVKHGVGQRFGGTTILHVGDYDASGECMFDALAEDARAFAEHYGEPLEFVRLAVTPDQIQRYRLSTAPPKDSSHQAKKRLTETTQAEAFDPATLAVIVSVGIESRLDMDIYHQSRGSRGAGAKRIANPARGDPMSAAKPCPNKNPREDGVSDLMETRP